jgi:hypothetical protein
MRIWWLVLISRSSSDSATTGLGPPIRRPGDVDRLLHPRRQRIPDDNDDLLVATMGDRARAKAVARNGKVSLCVLDETWPFAYLQVYCDAVIDDDETLIDVMMAVAERMSGEPVPAELRPAVKAVAEQEGRVLMRCRPYATFVTPPRHLHHNDQQELTHWVSASMPWHAPDAQAE